MLSPAAVDRIAYAARGRELLTFYGLARLLLLLCRRLDESDRARVAHELLKMATALSTRQLH